MPVKILPLSDGLSSVLKTLQFLNIDEPFGIEHVAQAIRRACQILAPCSGIELSRAVKKSLKDLILDEVKLDEMVDDALEDLLIYGEIFELRSITNDPWQRSNFSLRPAPPSYVMRPDGSAIILGIAGDDLIPFTEEVAAMLLYEGVLRILPADVTPDLGQFLKEMNLIRLELSAWLRLPAIVSTDSYIRSWEQKLIINGPPEEINGLQVLDFNSSTTYYKGRWKDTNSELNGVYIAKRPQKYGNPQWCLAQFNNGVMKTFMDLFSVGDRLRPCDIAWRIQMAFDSARGNPQKVEVKSVDAGLIINFFSPVPSWAEKRLSLFGKRIPADRCLFSYLLPSSIAEGELKFLHDYLWIENK